MTFLDKYVYLGWSLVLLILFTFSFWGCPKQRKPMLISALLGAPASLASIFFVPEYWDPVRLAVFLTGPEDVIFSFSCGGVVWVFATWPFRDQLIYKVSAFRIFGLFILFLTVGITIIHLLSVLGFRVMTAVLVSIVLLGATVGCWRKDLLPVAFVGAASFPIFYFVVLQIVLAVFPHFLNQWNWENLWGIIIMDIPLEEYAWAFTYGAVHPLVTAYILELKILDCSSPEIVTKQEPFRY